MSAVNDFDYVLMNKPDGGQVWLPVPFGTGCSITTVYKTPAEVASLSSTMPATPSGGELLTRACPNFSVITVTSDPNDFTPEGTTNPPVNNADQFIITGTFSTP